MNHPAAIRWPLLLALLSLPVHAGEDDEEEAMEIDFAPMSAPAPARVEVKAARIEFSGLEINAPNYSAQVGGARDTRRFRELLDQGVIGPPELFPAEGLLSEYDLPARQVGPCDARLCLLTEAGMVDLLGAPEAQAFAQLGFDTNLPPDVQRPPINLVVVWDGIKTTDMDYAVARALLDLVSARLTPQDQITVVMPDQEPLYNFGGPAGTRLIADALTSSMRDTPYGGVAGGEAALLTAFELAQRRQAGFGGMGRVLWLTAGDQHRRGTDSPELRALAQSAGDQDIGLTVFGLGSGFNPVGLDWVSSLPGGVYSSAASTSEVVDTIAKDLESLIWPLAYDFSLELQPAPGWRLSGVYGIPNAALQWDSHGSARLTVKTLFVSRERGAIYFAFAPEGVSELPAVPLRVGESLASARVSWRESGAGEWRLGDTQFTLEEGERSVGWRRGELLVEELLFVHALAARVQRREDTSDLSAQATQVLNKMAYGGELDLFSNEIFLILNLANVANLR